MCVCMDSEPSYRFDLQCRQGMNPRIRAVPGELRTIRYK